MADAAQDDTVPWLQPTPVIHDRRSPLLWLAAALVLGLVAASAFLLGRSTDMTPHRPPAEPLPNAPSVVPTSPFQSTPGSDLALPPGSEALPLPPALSRAAQEEVGIAAPVETATAPRPKLEQIRAAQQIAREHRSAKAPAAVTPSAPNAAVKPAYDPRLDAPGRVIQLGTYPTTKQAEHAAELFRYRYRGLLATLPKAVMPIRPQGATRLFYRVQFIAPSQAYAEVACQRLRAADKKCLVLY